MVRSSKFSSHSSEAQHTFCNGEVRFVERQVVVASERRAATERRARRTRSPQLRSMSLLLWLVVFCAGGALFDRALERVFVRDVVASLVVLFGKKKKQKAASVYMGFVDGEGWPIAVPPSQKRPRLEDSLKLWLSTQSLPVLKTP